MPYCLKCRKNTEKADPKVSKIKNSKAMLSSTCVLCGIKKLNFMHSKLINRFRYWVEHCFNCVDAFNNWLS